MLNQESLKAYLALVTRGHFNCFLGDWYPVHITALLRLDLTRICQETGFADPAFAWTNEGTVPKLLKVVWQRLSFGLLRGRLFSDNVAMVARKLPLPSARTFAPPPPRHSKVCRCARGRTTSRCG